MKELTSPGGRRLAAGKCQHVAADAGHAYLATPDGWWCGGRAEVIAAMYEAAGLPAPVILERPEPRDVLVPGRDRKSWVTVERSPDTSAGARAQTRDGRGIPGVMLSLEGVDGGSIRLIGDEPLRVALALVDAMRPAVDEPDPAEVRQLAELICRPGVNAAESDDIARILLRAGYRREASRG